MLQVRRRELGMTQAEIAKKTGYNVLHYSRIERGMCDLPVDAVWTFADAMGIELDRLTKAAIDDHLPRGWEAVQT